jgi:hypothetical protein
MFFGVTGGTLLLRVLVWFRRYHGCHLRMTGPAQPFEFFRSRDGSQWLMRILMAVAALHDGLVGTMGRIMAFTALRNTAMFFGMTGRALLLRVLVWFCRYHGCHLRMTGPAQPFQGSGSRDGSQWLVRILMTGEALHDRFGRAMGCSMAVRALRHNLGVIIPQRIVGMENLMAIGTHNPAVFATLLFNPGKM